MDCAGKDPEPRGLERSWAPWVGLKLGHLLRSRSGEVGATGTQPGIYTRGDPAAEVAVRGSSRLGRVGTFLHPVAFAGEGGRSQGQAAGAGTALGSVTGSGRARRTGEGPQDLCWSLGDVLLGVGEELVAGAPTRSLSTTWVLLAQGPYLRYWPSLGAQV